MKVGLIGLFESENLGDPLLHETTKYLIRKNSEDVIIDELWLFGAEMSVLETLISKSLTLFIKVLEKVGVFKNTSYLLLQKRSSISSRNYFDKRLKQVDSVIFSGGGLIKFKYEGINYRINDIIRYCEKRAIPVYFNAVGVEGYDEDDIRFLKLKKSLNSDIVKGISTRDDFNTLKQHYINNPAINIYDVVDSAFWSDSLYQISSSNSSIIGIGVIRAEIFQDNGIDNFKKDDLTRFYTSLAKELTEMNVDWEFYTNGLSADNEYLKYLLDTPEIKLLNVSYSTPNNLEEFVSITSKYRTIFAARMHASILAYSLQIPSFGVVWNQKVRKFSEIIGYKHRYFDVANLDYKEIAKGLSNAKYNSSDLNTRDSLRSSTSVVLGKFLDEIKKQREIN